MTDKQKQFYNKVINVLKNQKCDNPLMMLSPLIQNINHTQYQKLRGHMDSCEYFIIEYKPDNSGYSDGVMSVAFHFTSSKSKYYAIKFMSHLEGDYGTTEWWVPAVDVSISENLNTSSFKGTMKDYKKFEVKLTSELSNDKEIQQLKQEIAEKQRKLSEMTKAS